MLPPAPETLAQTAAALWSAEVETLALLTSAGTTTYRVQRAGAAVYLRLTNPTFRTVAQNQAECDFVNHLQREGLQVSVPLKSSNGREVEPFELADGIWSAQVFTEAPGVIVRPGDALWGEAFVRAWGRALGELHRGATTYGMKEGHGRWAWDEDLWLATAERLLPAADTPSRQEFETVMNWFRDLPKTLQTYGLTHSDYGPQNFHYDPQLGITSFDFGNLSEHWFMWDIAICLSIVLWRPVAERRQVRAWLLESYAEVFPLDEALLADIDWFLRLRMLYVYLSRLWWFGEHPTAAEEATLARIRRLVHNPVSWEKVDVPTWRG